MSDSKMAPKRIREAATRELKFQSLAEEMRRDILAGTWPVGSKLPTEADVAATSGLSMTTVRRAFDELVTARLITRRQGAGSFVAERVPKRGSVRFTVGVLLPDTHLYYPRVLQGIEETLRASNVSLHIATYDYDASREDASVELMLEAGVDGLILVPTLTDLPDPARRIQELTGLGLPVVLLERNLTDLGPADATEHVCSDHAGGAYDAVVYLRSLGHRAVSLLTRANTATEPGIAAGYLRAAQDLDFAPHVQRVTKEEWEAGAATRLVEELVAQRATACLVFGDREATQIQAACRRAGLSVPQDLAIISYDDELADVAEVPLTAVSPAKHRLGRMAADVMLQRLREGDACPIHQVRLRPRLIVRDSCGGPHGLNAPR